jgi:hypothetical protein
MNLHIAIILCLIWFSSSSLIGSAWARQPFSDAFELRRA